MPWRSILKSNFTNWELLADFLELSESQRALISPHPEFKLNLPRRLAEKIEKCTLDDPILRQFLPLVDENQLSPGYVDDPVGDWPARSTLRLLQKYTGRALIIASSACAMHCRFCFRRNFPYERGESHFLQELEMIKSNPSLDEIILSGGDPLSLANWKLKGLFEQLDQIGHVKRVRFHTRYPIGIPERIDAEFLSLMANTRFKVWFVIHCNHPRELDQDVLQALQSILKSGIPVLNQAVLLKGVNDDENTLITLFQTLANEGIFAYYLHQLDRARGASHFEVEQARGLELVRHLTEKLPGYAVPKYVREVAHEKSKTGLHFL